MDFSDEIVININTRSKILRKSRLVKVSQVKHFSRMSLLGDNTQVLIRL